MAPAEAMMEQQQKLDPITEIALRSLKDIALPAPVSWFPQTWGWALLAILLVLALMAWLAIALRRYRRNAYRREALLILAKIEGDINTQENLPRNLDLLAELLKRTALAAWPREKVARAAGPEWTAILDASQPRGIGDALSRFLQEAEYRGGNAAKGLPSGDTGDIIADARRWIEQHHVPA